MKFLLDIFSSVQEDKLNSIINNSDTDTDTDTDSDTDTDTDTDTNANAYHKVTSKIYLLLHNFHINNPGKGHQ